MPEMIGDVIARWRQGVAARPLPPDRAATVSMWMAEIVVDITAAGFTVSDLLDEMGDYTQTWLEREYDDLRRQERGVTAKIKPP